MTGIKGNCGDREILSEINIAKSFAILIGPFVIVLVLGVANYGLDFFSFKHWLRMNGPFIPPFLGIPAFVIAFIFSISMLTKIYRARNIFCYFQDREICFYNGLKFDVPDIDYSSIECGGHLNNKLSFFYRGRIIEIPLIFAKGDNLQLTKRIKELRLAVST